MDCNVCDEKPAIAERQGTYYCKDCLRDNQK